MMTSDASYVCYFLSNETHQRTYVGISNNVPRRLRQHNGEIKGGARATRAYGPWHIEVIVTGFVNKSQCLSFEWFMMAGRPYQVPNLPLVGPVYRLKDWFVTDLRTMAVKIKLVLDSFNITCWPTGGSLVNHMVENTTSCLDHNLSCFRLDWKYGSQLFIRCVKHPNFLFTTAHIHTFF